MRISRGCYDKFHRCPGWAGGGIRHAKKDKCPDAGYVAYLTATRGGDRGKRLWKWRFNQCPQCRVFVLPSVTRWLDPGWWGWKITDWRDDLDNWRKGRS